MLFQTADKTRGCRCLDCPQPNQLGAFVCTCTSLLMHLCPRRSVQRDRMQSEHDILCVIRTHMLISHQILAKANSCAVPHCAGFRHGSWSRVFCSLFFQIQPRRPTGSYRGNKFWANMCCFGSYSFLSLGSAGGLDLSKHVIIHVIFTDGISGEYPSDVLKAPKVTSSNALLKIQIALPSHASVCIPSSHLRSA